MSVFVLNLFIVFVIERFVCKEALFFLFIALFREASLKLLTNDLFENGFFLHSHFSGDKMSFFMFVFKLNLFIVLVWEIIRYGKINRHSLKCINIFQT